MLLSGMLAMLLVFGSSGDTQAPTDGLPPWNLSSPSEVAVFRSALENTKSLWVAAFDSQLTLKDITFHPVLAAGGTCIFVGSIQTGSGQGAASQSALFSFAPTAQAGQHTIAYLHVLGSGCLTPPDQVYTAFRMSPRVGRIAKNELLNLEQFEFLTHVLEGLAGGSTDPSLVQFGSWFGAGGDLALENFRASQSGAMFGLDLIFRDSSGLVDERIVISILAVQLPSGDFSQVVIR